MQTCHACGAKLHWAQRWRSQWLADPIVCRTCGRIHDMRFQSKAVFIAVTILPVLLFNAFSTYENWIPVLTWGAFYIALVSLFTPFLLRYDLRPEPKKKDDGTPAEPE
ncbi:TIGR04104 family putative zinc finger protein [Alkalicoccus chagannorensis]|uniref:TIGR04104 family putative zinc finger protein n=1 Tax=Alkalicoccus chagannorensis TaxID=427072 RepID=UPI0003F7751B|nr:TIGR04104 family putative zinc finger protein [Alkalicoccus chagannorensis]